jgi:hypothetical protein
MMPCLKHGRITMLILDQSSKIQLLHKRFGIFAIKNLNLIKGNKKTKNSKRVSPKDIVIRMAKANMKNLNHQTALPIVKMKSLTKQTITRRNSLSIHCLRLFLKLFLFYSLLFIQVLDLMESMS